MAISQNKILQAYIQGLLEVIKETQATYIKLNGYKTLFDAKLLNTKNDVTLSEEEILEINNFFSAFDLLIKYSILSTLEAKDVPSHGTKALTTEE